MSSRTEQITAKESQQGHVIDHLGFATRAHAHGVKVAVDSTFASPAPQLPIERGADIVLHSLSKYINGHGDALGSDLIRLSVGLEDIEDVTADLRQALEIL